jgi:hypothetical protein
VGGREAFEGECLFGCVFLFLVAEEHKVAIFIFFALIFDFLEVFFKCELWFFFEFVGEEKVAEGVAGLYGEELHEIFEFFMGGDQKVDFVELRGLFFHEDDDEIGTLAAVRQSCHFHIGIFLHKHDKY